MKTQIIALHGFLGCGSDWDAVRAASKSSLDWRCPDLFSRGLSCFAAPDADHPCWLAGYSFGARLALRWMQETPDRYLGALLVSANPGNFQTGAERAARRAADAIWAEKFRRQPWAEVIGEWNLQQVFASDHEPTREESDFGREKLAAAMEQFSVGGQFTDPLRLPSRLVWLAGAEDEKFSAMLDAMRDAGFPGTFLRVDGAGHRLLRSAPGAVAAALDDLVA